MADIFQEVDEELRRDKAQEWWRKYSLYVYIVAAVVVVGTGGYQAWIAYDLDQRSKRSADFAAALELADDGDQAGAIEALAALEDSSGYGLLAQFEQARLLAASGDSDAAIALWDALASNASSGAAYQGIATLLSVLHQIDDGDPSALEARLQPLAAAGAPYRASALELLAVLALNAGDTDTARAHLTEIADEAGAPGNLRRRATQLLATLKK